MKALKVVASALVPALVATAWIPLRRSLPNADIALVLVATIAVVARLGGRIGTVLGSASAALSFGYLHTEPYGHWQIAHARDVETTVLIVLVGVLVGNLTLRVFHHRAVADRGSRDLAVMAETAELMAVGDDPGLVLEAVAGELRRLLRLSDCEFAAGPPTGAHRWVERDGSLGARRGTEDPAGRVLDLPVWVQGQVLGHYRLVLAEDPPSADRLAVAVSLADQAGAALAIAPPTPPWQPGAAYHLRLVTPAPTAGSSTGQSAGSSGDQARVGSDRTVRARTVRARAG